MSDSDFPAGHRSGFVSVVGRPSVGKSTLINAFLGQIVLSVSPRPQTTRRRQLGILTLPQAQAVFVDTPGIHEPRNKLGEHLNATAREALEDPDLILAVFDLSQALTPEDRRTAEWLHSLPDPAPILAVLNKVDAARPGDLADRVTAVFGLLPQAEPWLVSATCGDGRGELLERILGLLPFGPRYYPADEVSDTFERDIAGDLIRAACLQLLRDEVPHGIAVRVDEYTERGDHGAYIAATLFVEKESHKGIVIGKGGAMLRQIGAHARREIEAMSGRRVYLETRVKVLPGWREDEVALRGLGFES
ncbi:MAG: GTPase Era [Chloroflexi bacterium RBG_13_68_17]|nr:MAG: GTPase Era [Chloroflexi bacterium RBG_13_68_17]